MGRIHQYLLILLVDIFNIYPKAMLNTGDEREWQVQGYLSGTFSTEDVVCFEITS